MSYSICINCHEMVPHYEKYCTECVKMNNLKQDEDWWKKPESRDYNAYEETQKDGSK